MFGTRTSTVSLAFLAMAACAAEPDYFPLQIGNQWVYRSSGGAGAETWSIDIPKYDVLGDSAYFLVRGFPAGDAWLRMGNNGTLFAYDPGQKREKMWAAFATAEGDTYPTEIDPCSKTARIVSRGAKISGPLGDFNSALQIAYPPAGCADAGITEDYYLPYIGLLRRTTTTIAGPKTFNLIYARLGGITVVSEKHVSFTLTLDRAVYVADLMPPVDPRRAVPQMTARLTLRSTQDDPVPLEFPSGQTYDLAIKNDQGDIVYQWSRGKAFTMVVRSEQFGPGEKNWAIIAPLGTPDNKPFPAGKYTAEAWLTTNPARLYSATVAFEVQHVQ